MTKLSMLWREYFEAKSESEKEAILKKICPGITSEGVEMMKRKMPEPWEQQEPEKGFMELLLEASATEDLTEKEAIYAKIEELEIKKEREGMRSRRQ